MKLLCACFDDNKKGFVNIEDIVTRCFSIFGSITVILLYCYGLYLLIFQFQNVLNSDFSLMNGFQFCVLLVSICVTFIIIFIIGIFIIDYIKDIWGIIKYKKIVTCKRNEEM